MKATVNIADLRKAVTTAKKVTSNSYAIPALAGARLTANGDTLTITTTDLDTSVTVTIPATVHDAGSCLVNVKELAGTTKGKGSVSLVADGANLTVQGVTTASLSTLDPSEYPVPVTVDGPSFVLDFGLLADVAVAASTDQARPILAGVMFECDTITATDSYRLHTVKIDGGSWPARNVPAKWLLAAGKCADKGTITFGDVNVKVEAGATVWTIRTTDHGAYPNWRQLVPVNPPAWFTANRDAFASLVDAVRPTGAGIKKSGATPVRLTFDGGSITATVTERDAATKTGQCGATWYMPDVPTVAYNGAFLSDALHATHEGSMVTVQLTDALKPAVIIDRPYDGAMFTALLMPVRV